MSQTLGGAMLTLLEQRLDTISRTVREVPTEQLYRPAIRGGNSIGNLALHVAGNLQALIGRIGGGIAYDRDREFEFRARDVSADDIVRRLEDARAVCRQVLPQLEPAWFGEVADDPLFPGESRGAHVLRSVEHAEYHGGQIVIIAKLVTDA